jgi:hypothetical protein
MNHWNGTRTLIPSFGSEWLLAVSKYKSVLKGRIFQDSEDIPKNVMRHWKPFHNRRVQKCFQQGQHRWAKCIAAVGQYFESDPRVYLKVSGLSLNEINNITKHSLRSNTKGYGGKTH